MKTFLFIETAVILMGSQECALCLYVFVHNKHIHIRVICASLTHEFFLFSFLNNPVTMRER